MAKPNKVKLVGFIKSKEVRCAVAIVATTRTVHRKFLRLRSTVPMARKAELKSAINGKGPIG